MVFSSPVFLLIFFPSIFIIYFNPFFKSRVFKNSILLIFSLFFYAWGEPVFVFLMIFSIIINYFFGIKINILDKSDANQKNQLHTNKKRKRYLIYSIIWNVFILFIFKYLSFLSTIFNQIFPNNFLPVVEIKLPIGISFFTFQIMSYIFDVYYKKVDVQKNIFNLALYVSVFPQLIAGPIVRYETIADEILNRKETAENITAGTKRFILGLAKKCLLANYLAVIADLIFDNNFKTALDFTFVDAWIGAIAYSMQIYFDFSGYSDMAIGLGLIFGFHFEENFNYPYLAHSVTDFWRRWHISLSSWFRDYVYIPMGGNRCKKSKAYFNMFVVWVLTGIWHGAAFTFWLWGIYYFVLLVIEKTLNLDNCKNKISRFFTHILTLLFVIIGWVLFRSNSLQDSFNYIKIMFTFNFTAEKICFLENYYLKNGGMILILGFVALFPLVSYKRMIIEKIENKINNKKKIFFSTFINSICQIMLLLIFVSSVLMCIKSTYNPFIYFNF